MTEEQVNAYAYATQTVLAKSEEVMSIRAISEAVGFSPAYWQDVKLRMIELGIPICCSARGHYLGDKGEQVTTIVRNYNHAHSRLKTSAKQLEALYHAKQLEEARQFSLLSLMTDLAKFPARIAPFGIKMIQQVVHLLSDGRDDRSKAA